MSGQSLRALHLRTENAIRPTNRFFITVKYWGQTGVSPLVLSAGFNLIKFAYTATSEETSFRKHKSAWGASNRSLLALQAIFALNAILENCCWTTNTTFSSCYLRDMSTHTGDLFSLGPLVITGEIIARPTLWLLKKNQKTCLKQPILIASESFYFQHLDWIKG